MIITLEEDENGNLILPLSDDVLEQVGWKLGDTIKWTDNKNGSFTMSKSQETELVLVETSHTFRIRYVVEVPKGKAEWALDTVVMDEAVEFSQEFIGENIISHRVLSEKDVLQLCDKDNDYVKTWSDELKLQTFVTPWVETK